MIISIERRTYVEAQFVQVLMLPAKITKKLLWLSSTPSQNLFNIFFTILQYYLIYSIISIDFPAQN